MVRAEPAATTNPASNITATGATLHGAVNPNGSTASASFQYSTDPAFSIPAIVSTLAGPSEGNIELNWIAGVARDAAGNIYAAEPTQNKIRKITPTGTVSTYAGSNLVGFADGPVASATFGEPMGLAVDTFGNVFVADSGNNRIRKITPSGIVSTLAGTGSFGPLEDGPGLTATFYHPSGLALDFMGNLYVADSHNNRIRKITPTGTVSTVAGSGVFGFADGPATTASFRHPLSLTVDLSGNIYVADTENHRIRKITPDGIVSTIAGSGTSDFADGSGALASFSYPSGIAVDTFGCIYVADSENDRIRKITLDGTVTTLAGTDIHGFADGLGSEAEFRRPFGLVIDAASNLYAADSNNKRLRIITLGLLIASQTNLNGTSNVSVNASLTGLTPGETYYFRTLGTNNAGMAAGDALSFTTPNTNPGLSDIPNTTINEDTSTGALSFTISDVETSPQSLIITATSDNTDLTPQESLILGGSAANRTLNITPVPNASGTATITVTVSDGFLTATDTFSLTVNSVNDAPLLAPINNPAPIFQNASLQTVGLAGIGTGAANENQTLVVTAASDNPALIPHPTITYTSPNATGSLQFTPNPDISGTAVITVTVNDGQAVNNIVTRTFTVTVLQLAPAVTTMAGTNITATSATLNGLVNPQNGTTDASFRYTTDPTFSSPVTVSTLAGSGTAGFADGIGQAASFNQPMAIAVDSADTLYIADMQNHRIRKLSPAGVVTTYAGTGTSGSTNGPAETATFSAPRGVALDSTGNLYVAEGSFGRIRKITAERIVSTFFAGGGFPPSAPFDVAVDNVDNVYFADFGGLVRKVVSISSATTVASGFNGPRSLAWSPDGTIYVGDHGNNRIRKIAPGGAVSTLAGSGTAGFADGTGTAASFWFPSGLTVGPDGNIYLGDAANHRVRKIAPTGVTATYAGSGVFGYADGLGTEAQFSSPRGVVFDSAGNLYVTESNGQRIRKITGGLTVPAQGGLTGTAPVAVNVTLMDLQPDTTYYYRASALNSGGPTVGTILNFTTLAIGPSNLGYSANPAAYVKNTAIASNAPSHSGGNIASYSIFPALPDGLFFDTNTGVISGMPLVSAPETEYTITGTNSGGSTDIIVSLTVFDSALAVFRSQNALTADGSYDLLTPAGDGVSNLLKFAFNMIGIGAGQAPSLFFPNSSVLSASGEAGLPFSGVDENGRLTITFIRRKAATNPGITYAVEFSNTNLNGSWAENGSATTQVEDIDTTFERVTVTDSETGPRRFVRVKISVE